MSALLKFKIMLKIQLNLNKEELDFVIESIATWGDVCKDNSVIFKEDKEMQKEANEFYRKAMLSKYLLEKMK